MDKRVELYEARVREAVGGGGVKRSSGRIVSIPPGCASGRRGSSSAGDRRGRGSGWRGGTGGTRAPRWRRWPASAPPAAPWGRVDVAVEDALPAGGSAPSPSPPRPRAAGRRWRPGDGSMAGRGRVLALTGGEARGGDGGGGMIRGGGGGRRRGFQAGVWSFWRRWRYRPARSSFSSIDFGFFFTGVLRIGGPLA